MIRYRTCLIAILLAFASASALAQGFIERQVLTAPAQGEGGPSRLYGQALAIDGDLAVVAESNSQDNRLFGFRRISGVWQRAPELDLHDPEWQISKVALSEDSMLVRSARGSEREVRFYRATSSGWVLRRSASSGQSSFGTVAIDGSIAVIGAPGAPGDVGQVLVFRRDGSGNWDFMTILRPTPAEPGARFGESVAIVAGAVVIGAPGEDAPLAADAGAAYIFELTQSTWTQVSRLQRQSATDGSFGIAVAISGLDEAVPDRLLIGARGSSNTGQVFVFRRNAGTWVHAFAIDPPVAQVDSGFGERLSLDGNSALIGAPSFDNSAGNNAGVVWSAQFSGGFTTATLTRHDDPQPEASAFFGNAVAIDRDGPTALAGAPRANLYGPSSGAVAMSIGTVTQPFPPMQRALALGRGQDLARFGAAISSDGDTLLVGAPGEAISRIERSGAVYFYRRAQEGHWEVDARIQSPQGQADDSFGEAVAVNGDLALVGAPGVDLGGIDSGAVYVYRRSNGFWIIDRQLLLPCPSVQRRAFGRRIAFDGTRAIIGALCPPATSGGPSADIGVFIGTRQPDGEWSFGLVEAAGRMSSGGWDAGLAVIGSHNADGSVDGVQGGFVRTFAWDGMDWQFVGSSDNGTNGPPPQGYGLSLGIDQGLLAVASHRANTPVLVRRRSGDSFLPEATLLPADLATTDTLRTTAVHGERIAVGAAQLTVGVQNAGAVFLFERRLGTWQQTQRLLSPIPEQSSGFGDSLTFGTDGALLVAAPGASRRFRNEGVVHVWAAPSELLFRNGFE